MRELKNHPGERLQDEMARQLDKFEDDHGVISINRATVSREEQLEAIARWDKGGKLNRPPYLYEPLRPPEKSKHVTGEAIDTSHITLLLREGRPYGLYQRYSWDKPHFEFDPSLVTIRATNSGSGTVPAEKKRKLEMLPTLMLQDTGDVWRMVEGVNANTKRPEAQKRRVSKAEMNVYRAAAVAQGIDIDQLLKKGMEGVKLSDIPNAPGV